MAVRTNEVGDVEIFGSIELHRHTFARIGPFAFLAFAALASVALPPGPASDRDVVWSAALLGLTALLYGVLRLMGSRAFALLVPVCYAASALMLILGAGGSRAGIGLIVLLPIVWASLNLDFVESLAVVVAVGVIELVTSFTPLDVTSTVRFRREASFLLIGGLIVVSIHELRTRILGSNAIRDVNDARLTETIIELDEQRHISAIIYDLVEMLNFCNDVDEAYEVFEHAARQVFELGGSINILNAATGKMEGKRWWPGARSGNAPFDPEACFAIQNGQPYVSGDLASLCEHFASDIAPPTLCQPLFINRETVGLLAVSIPDEIPGDSNAVADKYKVFSRRVGDQASIWLANFRLRENLKHLSIRDPLTNLYNRRFMMETLHREMVITSRSGEATSVMQIDIDNFKDFNDTFGHDVGDAVLRGVADEMIGLFRESDVPCRSGGEEFTLILPRCSWETAHVRAVELQSRVAGMVIKVEDDQVAPRPPTLSIGIATSPEHGQLGDQLLRAADVAMYRAKTSGRNRIERAVA
jgi:diguanylate cyclase (GGDEF)-like protein